MLISYSLSLHRSIHMTHWAGRGVGCLYLSATFCGRGRMWRSEQLRDKSVTGRTPQLSSAHNRKPQFKVSSLRKQNFVATRIVVLIPRSRGGGRGGGDHRRRITIDVCPRLAPVSSDYFHCNHPCEYTDKRGRSGARIADTIFCV